MRTPTPELRAMRKLADRYNRVYEKLLKQELDAMGVEPVVDANNTEIALGDTVKTKYGDRVKVTRIDVRSGRCVVQHRDGHKQLLMGHLLTIVKQANRENELAST